MTTRITKQVVLISVFTSAFAIGLLNAPSSVEAKGETVLCLETQKRSYISAHRDKKIVNATGKLCRGWERVKIIDINGGKLVSGDKIHIQAHHGQYLSVHPRGIISTTPNKKSWETITIVKTGGSKSNLIKAQDRVAFKTVHKTWIYAKNGGNGDLLGNSTKRSKNAEFRMSVLLLSRTATKPIKTGKYAGDKAQIRNAAGLCLIPSKNGVRAGKCDAASNVWDIKKTSAHAYQLFHKKKCLTPKPGVLADTRIPLVLAAKCTRVFSRSKSKAGWIRYANHCLSVRNAKKGTVDLAACGKGKATNWKIRARYADKSGFLLYFEDDEFGLGPKWTTSENEHRQRQTKKRAMRQFGYAGACLTATGNIRSGFEPRYKLCEGFIRSGFKHRENPANGVNWRKNRTRAWHLDTKTKELVLASANGLCLTARNKGWSTGDPRRFLYLSTCKGGKLQKWTAIKGGKLQMKTVKGWGKGMCLGTYHHTGFKFPKNGGRTYDAKNDYHVATLLSCEDANASRQGSFEIDTVRSY